MGDKFKVNLSGQSPLEVAARLAALEAAMKAVVELLSRGGGSNEGVVYFSRDQIDAISKALAKGAR